MGRAVAGNMPSNAPVQVQAPVVGTTNGRWRFGSGTAAGGPSQTARPCYVHNRVGGSNPVYIRVNAYNAQTPAWEDATVAFFDVEVADGASYDLSEGGLIAVHSLSVWIGAGTASGFSIRGFTGS